MAKHISVADYIKAQIEVCGKTQKVIAEEVGFPKANVLTMIKKGQTRIPIPRVNALADSLGVNRAKLMTMVLKEYMPDVLIAIEEALGNVDVNSDPEGERARADKESNILDEETLKSIKDNAVF